MLNKKKKIKFYLLKKKIKMKKIIKMKKKKIL